MVDERSNNLPARISVTDSRQRALAPDDAWIHADDLLVRERQAIETRYFHTRGRSRISVPLVRLAITVSHGPAFEIAHTEEDPRTAGWTGMRTVTLKRLAAPVDSGEWWSGDLHVHMNYGGLYRNIPSRLADQGNAEDLNLIYNLVVNKEQRFPDIASFPPDPHPASTDRLLILHRQEFHTSYFLRWLDRIRSATAENSSYRTAGERAAVQSDIARAREFYEQCLREAPGEGR